MANIVFFFAFLLTCCSYALIRGGAPERIVAAIMLVVPLLTMSAASSLRPTFETMEAGVLIVDSVMLLALVAIALTAHRYWPTWMAGMQLVQVAGHAVKFASPELMPFAYAEAQALWAYPMIALLALGTWRHARRLKTLGHDRSWRGSSDRLREPTATP